MRYNEVELLKIWDKIKYDIKLNKEIDRSKLLSQLNIVKSFIDSGMRSIIMCATGYGKTMVAIILVKLMNINDSSRKTIVIVPKKSLSEDWTKVNGLINTFNLKNIEIFVVNSYVLSGYSHKCDFLILDECHRYSNEDADEFSRVLEVTNYKYVLGMSATLDLEKQEFFRSRNIPIIAEITLKECEFRGWVAKHTIYNLGLELGDEPLVKESKGYDEIANTVFAKFQHNYGLARACSLGNKALYYHKEYRIKQSGLEWKQWYAKKMGWNEGLGMEHDWSPKNIGKLAHQWSWAIQQRQAFLHNAQVKKDTVVKLVKMFNKPTIIFSESQKFADEISLLLEGSCEAYHSGLNTVIYSDKSLSKLIAIGEKVEKKLYFRMVKSGDILTYKEIKSKFKTAFKLSADKVKSKIKEDFNKGIINELSTVSSLDEGFDSDRIELGIVASGKGVILQDKQRIGRTIRKKGTKESVMINLFIKETQDEKWLNKRQVGTPKGKIKWVYNINDIRV